MHARGDKSLFPTANLGVDQMLWPELQLPFHLQIHRDISILLLPRVKRDKARKGLHRTIETVWKSCYPIYAMKFIDLKVFLLPPVLEWDLTNQSVKL